MTSKLEQQATRPAPAPQCISDVAILREQVKTCTACDLCETKRPAVPSRGPIHAKIMIVGEQPGDEEDKQGIPFVGPAGTLLSDILRAENIDEDSIYFTNSVKHFRYVIQGKRRIHKRPDVKHVKSCRTWLTREMELVKPDLIFCLGATATHGVLGYALGVNHARLDRTLRHENGARVRVSYHPAALLRATDTERRRELEEALRSDIREAFDLVKTSSVDPHHPEYQSRLRALP